MVLWLKNESGISKLEALYIYTNSGSHAVVRELGSGQGDIMTRIPNSNHTWSSGIDSDVAFVT